ncbi:SET domain-containing protein [Lindgomyces ingoldianus]|uniref:SET domain-containing protein n=1 Tax=Lindgomyces ingoldianus TaxID=673940 RepID=A0ACB6Q9I8_9PLEO|nr:SET domain-containing protein [Lindgomyces ingoldianus]KAF2463694.1 SET domain-containing protein [Lindgomyces ingoldianus]
MTSIRSPNARARTFPTKRTRPAFNPGSTLKTGLAAPALEKYFWYTGSDKVTRLATTDTIVPEQINTYAFNKCDFARLPYPSSFPPSRVWPPQTASDLLCALGTECDDCVGDTCYTDAACYNADCIHTLENWDIATRDWTDHFSLQMTASCGIGVFTKSAFKKGTVLGWYAGELKPPSVCFDNDYLMELEIGIIPPLSYYHRNGLTKAGDTVIIDGRGKGNWVRFVNHNCSPCCMFRIRRVGDVRIMVVEAVRDISVGAELSVDYGRNYYGEETVRSCKCGARNCVGVRREGGGLQKKLRVKRCKREGPPGE